MGKARGRHQPLRDSAGVRARPGWRSCSHAGTGLLLGEFPTLGGRAESLRPQRRGRAHRIGPLVPAAAHGMVRSELEPLASRRTAAGEERGRQRMGIAAEHTLPPAALAMDADLEAAWQERWQGWWSRHALRAASDGGLFPDVIFRRLRDAVEISWGDVPSAGMPAGFDFLECSQRAVRLAPAEIAAPLHEALSSACSHLVSGAAESERIRELVRTLRALRRVGQRQKRLGWLAGLGTGREQHPSGIRANQEMVVGRTRYPAAARRAFRCARRQGQLPSPADVRLRGARRSSRGCRSLGGNHGPIQPGRHGRRRSGVTAISAGCSRRRVGRPALGARLRVGRGLH